MTVDGEFLHYIFPLQFLDSPEWDSLRPSEEGFFQVNSFHRLMHGLCFKVDLEFLRHCLKKYVFGSTDLQLYWIFTVTRHVSCLLMLYSE